MGSAKSRNRRLPRPDRRARVQTRAKRGTRLVLGLGGLLIFGLIGLALWLGGDRRASSSPTVDLDKSKGPANAAVVVEEYGDFQ